MLNLMQVSPGDPGGFPKNVHVGVDCGSAKSITRRGTSSVTRYSHAPNAILVEVSCLSRSCTTRSTSTSSVIPSVK